MDRLILEGIFIGIIELTYMCFMIHLIYKEKKK
jgi:hypothetical protein